MTSWWLAALCDGCGRARAAYVAGDYRSHGWRSVFSGPMCECVTRDASDDRVEASLDLARVLTEPTRVHKESHKVGTGGERGW